MFQMMSMASSFGMVLILLPLIALAGIIPLIVYLVARWRDRNENPDSPDPQLGLKVALHFFRLITFQLMLMAIFIMLLGLISEAPTSELIRIALGIGLPSAGLWLLHIQVLAKSNNVSYKAVGRMFDGWNLIITAIPGMIGVIAVCSIIVAPGLSGARGDILRFVFPYVITYTGAWAFLGHRWLTAAGLIVPSVNSSIPPGGYGGMPPGPGQGYPQAGQGQVQGQPPVQPQSGGYPQQPVQPQSGGYPQQPQQPAQPAQPAQPQSGGFPQTPPGQGYPPQGGGGGQPQ